MNVSLHSSHCKWYTYKRIIHLKTWENLHITVSHEKGVPARQFFPDSTFPIANQVFSHIIHAHLKQAITRYYIIHLRNGIILIRFVCIALLQWSQHSENWFLTAYLETNWTYINNYRYIGILSTYKVYNYKCN